MTTYFIQALIYLCAAVIAVPLAKRAGLGSVLGYLIAGIVIGPVIGLVGQEAATLQHFAEFGVVMMLFLVGLELEPRALWDMRHRLVGLGSLQIALTTLAILGIALFFGESWTVGLVVGLILTLSSTAIVLQTLNEKGLAKTVGGRSSFSVLLFQDIAVIPMLAVIPLLAIPELAAKADALLQVAGSGHEELSLVAHLPGWSHMLVVLAAVGIVVAGGHFLSRPLFRYVAQSGLREIFTTTALMLVIGIAAIMSLVGLSPALGTFLAGMVLATSEFRHELESDIEPFKGLLLGLFFITVGAGINFAILFDHLGLVLGITCGLIVLKAGILFMLSSVFKVKGSDRWLLALGLAQAGEFGFVLLNYSTQNNALSQETTQILSLVVALSMLLTPGLFIFFERFILPRYRYTENRQADTIDETGSVIIAGIGRFGQIVNRLLTANNIKTIVLDHQAERVELMRTIKVKSYFGDATRPDLLRSAGIHEAKLLIVAIDRDRTTQLVQYARQNFPHLKILARAYDRGHNYELRVAGADHVVSETYHSALELGKDALAHLGMPMSRAEQLRNSFQNIEATYDEKLYDSWKNMDEAHKFTQHYRELFLQLESEMRAEMKKESP